MGKNKNKAKKNRDAKKHKRDLKRKASKERPGVAAGPKASREELTKMLDELNGPAVDLGPKPPGREISPADNATVQQYANAMPIAGEAIREIRRQKRDDERPLPSEHLVSTGDAPDLQTRRKVLDRIAALVDENATGRSDMSLHFAVLLARALVAMGFDAVAVKGVAAYDQADGGAFSWDHAWVVYGSGTVVVDGNADSMIENVMVPEDVRPASYWGPVDAHEGRRFTQSSTGIEPEDDDVDVYWWPELRRWLAAEGLARAHAPMTADAG